MASRSRWIKRYAGGSAFSLRTGGAQESAYASFGRIYRLERLFGRLRQASWSLRSGPAAVGLLLACMAMVLGSAKSSSFISAGCDFLSTNVKKFTNLLFLNVQHEQEVAALP